ncbi:MAG TPA: hypothetical protein VGJ18_04665 [Gemmatimonadaceae bacterium]|jgi:hypothetical protein
MADPLKNIKRKLARAREHIDACDVAAKAFFTSQFYTTRIEHDRPSRWWSVVIDTIKPVPPEIGILAGEGAHHLRSSLDHLMWLLARPATVREAIHVEFPITSSRREFVGRRKGAKKGGGGTLPGVRYKMMGVPRGVRAAVERLQPYNSGKNPHADMLGFLREVSNWDKHRSLPIVAASVRVADLHLEISGGVLLSQETLAGILKAETALAHVQIRHARPTCYVNMKPELSVEPFCDDVMPEPVRGINTVRALHWAGWFIEQRVLPALRGFL